jgi:hypothetical protein
MKQPRNSTAIALFVILALVPGTLSGCGTARSTQAYCDTMQKHKDRYLLAMSDATKQVQKGDTTGVVGGLAATISALGDIQRMWKSLLRWRQRTFVPTSSPCATPQPSSSTKRKR